MTRKTHDYGEKDSEQGEGLAHNPHGPYMTNEMYSIQATAVIVAGILLYFAFVKGREQLTAENDTSLVSPSVCPLPHG
jgi:hypothetical protein